MLWFQWPLAHSWAAATSTREGEHQHKGFCVTEGALFQKCQSRWQWWLHIISLKENIHMVNTTRVTIIIRVWTPENTAHQSLCFCSSYKMYRNMTHIFLHSLLPECTLAQLFLCVRQQFIISSKYKKKAQRRSTWGQALLGAQKDRPKSPRGSYRTWHHNIIQILLCEAVDLCHMYLCVPVLAGLFCNVSCTAAGTNTTSVPDCVSMPWL